jgi:hypothetical protein
MTRTRLCFRVTLAASALLAFSQSLSAQTAPAAKPQSKSGNAIKFATEVPLLDCDGIPCVEARVGEGKPIKMGIDTGDVSSVIDKAIADAAGLKPTKAMPAGAPASMFLTAIPVVHVGGVALREVPTLSMSLSEMVEQKQMPDVSGTLAYTAFKDRVLQIDFVAHKVRISEALSAPERCDGACDKLSLITFGKKGPSIVVAQGFEINGQSVTAQLDTMYTGTLLVYDASIDKLGLTDAAKSQKTEMFAFTDGGVEMKSAPAGKESFHGSALGVSAPVVYFPTPDVHQPDGLFDATVGLGLLYGSVLTLDFRDMTISIVKP